MMTSARRTFTEAHDRHLVTLVRRAVDELLKFSRDPDEEVAAAAREVIERIRKRYALH
jgi:hypothetical protein